MAKRRDQKARKEQWRKKFDERQALLKAERQTKKEEREAKNNERRKHYEEKKALQKQKE